MEVEEELSAVPSASALDCGYFFLARWCIAFENYWTPQGEDLRLVQGQLYLTSFLGMRTPCHYGNIEILEREGSQPESTSTEFIWKTGFSDILIVLLENVAASTMYHPFQYLN